jgi:STE24 endopeptidase
MEESCHRMQGMTHKSLLMYCQQRYQTTAEPAPAGQPAQPPPKVKQYQREKIRLRVASIVLELALLALLLFGGLSLYLRQLIEHITINPWLLVACYVVVLGIANTLLSFPLDFYAGFSLEHKYHLSAQRFRSWLMDYLKDLLITGGILLLIIELLYFFLRHFPASWWLIFGAVVTIFIVILTQLAPVVIFPLFFKFTPLKDEELIRRLRTLAEKTGTPVTGIFEMDLSKKSKTANAALAGLGRTRRIILADTLLAQFTPDEIEVIMAHEFGHHLHRHLPKAIVMQTAMVFIFLFLSHYILHEGIRLFGFVSLSDVANLPLIAAVFSVCGLLIMPAGNALLRRLERRADISAIRLSANPAAFISAMERIAALNLADPNPNPVVEFIFYSHPSIQKRIELCRRLCQTASVHANGEPPSGDALQTPPPSAQ